MIFAQLTVIQIINIAIIAVVLFFFLRYAFKAIREKPHQPFSWTEAAKGKKIRAELLELEKAYPDKVRLYNWWLQVKRLKDENIRGAFAELGVYKGASAKILAMMDRRREFHLFDTFEGFPPADLQGETGDAATYTPQNFGDTSLEKVKKTLKGYGDFVYHKGYFPETTVGLENVPYALVNMDADLYKPTKAGLEYFYPRLSPGGVIFVHDYNPKWPGIIRAVDEFKEKIPETVVMVPDIEGTVMIIRSKNL
jgi:O-methyltransferase